MGILAFFILILVASAFVPQYVVVFLFLNLGLGLFFSFFQSIIALFPHPKPKQRLSVEPSFVSLIVPAYNEPPAILMQTLESLRQLDHNRFEVLVIDNNTRDQDVWRPVESFVQTLSASFRFFHVDKLSGFKAGALNYALDRLYPQSQYVAVIDADYVVKPNFLNTALSYFLDDKIALVQFPQRYRNGTVENQSIADEYSHFFEIYMNMANRLDCVPSTGTVSVYRLDALRKVGGFRGEALTEDADVGLRLYGAGYRGVYADVAVGYGLMPYDLESYHKQKWRWAFGNVQSLKTLIMLFGKIPFTSWTGFLLHLTAWHHFHFLPFAALAAFPLVLSPIIPFTYYHKEILVIASLSLFITLASKFLLFLVTLRKKKNFFSRSVKAFFIHMGMTLVYSEAWVAFALGRKFIFERTNKFILNKMPSLLKNSYKELLLGLWYLVGVIVSVMWGDYMVAFAFFVSAVVLFSVYYVYWKIYPTKQFSEKLSQEADEKYKDFLLKIER